LPVRQTKQLALKVNFYDFAIAKFAEVAKYDTAYQEVVNNLGYAQMITGRLAAAQLVQHGNGKLSVVLAGHPKLKKAINAQPLEKVKLAQSQTFSRMR